MTRDLCIQCLHIGPYDEEPKTLAQMDAFAVEQGYRLDFSETRFHHEIYLSDPRQSRDMCRILRQGACIMRSIWGTRAAPPRKSSKPCCGIRYGKNKNRKIHKGCRFCL